MIRSARLTVEKRCEMYTAVRPCVSERSRSNRSYSACASRADVGSARRRTRASPRMNARASAGRRGLAEERDARLLAHERAGERDLLPLPSGQVHPGVEPLAESGVVAL